MVIQVFPWQESTTYPQPIIPCFVPQAKIEWIENHTADPLCYFPELICDISNSCTTTAVSLRTSSFLSFIDIYGVMPSGCGSCDSSLSKAEPGLFVAAKKKKKSNNVFVTHCQTTCTPPLIFFCVPFFCTTKQICVLLSRGRWGNKRGSETQTFLVKLEAIIRETNGSVIWITNVDVWHVPGKYFVSCKSFLRTVSVEL